jgi:hypothetical protein
MKKISNKKLSLVASTVRVLDGEQLEAAGGAGVAIPTTTVYRHSVAANAAATCRKLSANFRTAMCVHPPIAAVGR